MGWALSAFGWAYALFEIPGGWLGDRIGPRRVLMRIVLWWSFFTAATGWALNGASLIVDPRAVRRRRGRRVPQPDPRLHDLAARRERERAQALLWLATRVSGAFTPLLVALLIDGDPGGARSSSSA